MRSHINTWWATLFGTSGSPEESRPFLSRATEIKTLTHTLPSLYDDLYVIYRTLNERKKIILESMHAAKNTRIVANSLGMASSMYWEERIIDEFQKWPFGFDENLLRKTIRTVNEKRRMGEINLKQNIDEPKYCLKEGLAVFFAFHNDIYAAFNAVNNARNPDASLKLLARHGRLIR